jgi:hypothetical protein
MRCITCEADKDESEFYRNRRTCKECVRRAVRTRARTNPRVQEYDRARAKTPKRKQHIRSVTKRWREENPVAYRAQTAVGNAIRDGRLFKEPCAICSETKVHAHHKDYSKPLEVVWLCARCHHRLHATFPELEGKMKAEFR